MKIAVQLLALLVIAVLPMPLHAAPDVLGLEPESLNALELESFEPWPESVGKTTAVSGRSENTSYVKSPEAGLTPSPAREIVPITGRSPVILGLT